MPTTVANIITYVDALKPNPYTDSQKLAWINKVEEAVKLNVMKTFKATSIQRLADTATYDLPAGVSFHDIDKAFIDGVPVRKIDYRSYLVTENEELGVYEYSSTKIGISPVPTSSDESSDPRLRIVYLEQFTPYSATSSNVQLQKEQHKSIYEWYLFAMIDLFNEDFDKYNNSMQQYNAAFSELENWYQSRQPIDTNLKAKNIW